MLNGRFKLKLDDTLDTNKIFLLVVNLINGYQSLL
jgi:hypothetical protein